MSTMSEMRRDAAKKWFAIESEGESERLAPSSFAAGMLVRFVHGPGGLVCENCGSELDTGRQNGEEDDELAARLKGARGEYSGVQGGRVEVVCPTCHREYPVFEDGRIDEEDTEQLGRRGMLPAAAQKQWNDASGGGGRPKRGRAPKTAPKSTPKTLLERAKVVVGNVTGVPLPKPGEAKCEHCHEPIEEHPVSFHTDGGRSRHFHPHHAPAKKR